MTTQTIAVPIGTSAAFPVGPNMSVCAAPAVLSGTVDLQVAPTQNGPWTSLYGAVAAARSTAAQGWVRVAAATKAASLIITDLSDRKPVLVNAVCATASVATEVLLYGLRIPAGYLSPTFRIDIQGSVSVTNSADDKTLAIKANGVSGTSIFTSPVLVDSLNYRFSASLLGMGDGSTIKGFGAGATGGFGLSTTAFTTLVRDYLTQETEIAFTGLKETAADTMVLDSLIITITP